MAEAMAYGKPVIATGYSGNLDFMTEETSYLVPYEITEIPDGVDPYPAGAEWAEPDVENAADLMRHVYEQQAEAAERGRLAREYVAKHLSPARTAAFLGDRLDAVWQLREDASFAPQTTNSSSATERAAHYLSEGPSIPITGASRFGFVGRLARRVVYRLLRPYTVRHAEFDSAIVEALADVRRDLAYEGLRARTRLESELERLKRAREADARRLNNLSDEISRSDH